MVESPSKYGLKLYNTKKCTTSALSTILHNNNQMPINIKLDLENSEQKTFLSQLNELTEAYVFIFDRNYYSYKILEAILKRNCDAVFRMKTDHTLFVSAFEKGECNDKMVYVLNGKQVTSTTKNAIKIRLVKYTINNEPYIICTTLLDKEKYDFEFITKFIS